MLPVFKESKAQVEFEIRKVIKCLGYRDNVKRYRMWGPIVHKVIISKDVMILQPKGFKE